jgi:hypothetical protein
VCIATGIDTGQLGLRRLTVDARYSVTQVVTPCRKMDGDVIFAKCIESLARQPQLRSVRGDGMRYDTISE